jgi:hypothetical protein
MNSEEIIWFILKCGAIFGVICLVFLLLVGASKAIAYVSDQSNLSNELRTECLDIGGEIEDIASMYPGDVTCVGYDNDSFKYYWHKNKQGDWYKSR